MSNRIDDKKGVTLPETTIKSKSKSDQADEPIATAPRSKAEDLDVFDDGASAYTEPWSDFASDGDAKIDPPSEPRSGKEAKPPTIKAGLVAAAGGISAASELPPKLEEHAILGDVVEVLQDESTPPDDLVGDDSSWLATTGAVESRVTSKLYDSDKQKLVALCADPENLEAYLADKLGERGDIDAGSNEAQKIAKSVANEIRQEVGSLVEHEIADRVIESADRAMGFLDDLERPGVKHAIADSVANSDAPTTRLVANVRESLGLSQEAAEDLIDGMHGEELEDATAHLQDWIDERKEGLIDLKSRADNKGMTDALLTHDLFAQTRDDVVADMTDEYGPGVEDAFEHVQSTAAADAKLESGLIAGVQVATGVTVTLATAGAAVPVAAALGMTAASSAPGIIESQDNINAGHAADLADVSTGGAGKEAEIDRNIAVGQAIGDAFFGVAPSQATGALKQAAETGINSSSTTGAATFFDWVTH